MARPARNINSTQLVTLLTPNRTPDEIPSGALRLPPIVGLQSIGGTVCNPTVGGLCIAVAAEACYILEGIVICVAGAISWPAVCVVLVVGAGVTIYFCLKEGTAEEQFAEGSREIEARFNQAQLDCRNRYAPRAGETPNEKLVREYDLSVCLQDIKRKIAQYIEELRQKLFGSGRGRGTIPSSTGNGGIRGTGIFEA